MDIQEITLRVSVLLEADSATQAANYVAAMSLEELSRQMDEGDLIGASQVIGARSLPDGQVHHRLQEIGNDGSFFEGAVDAADAHGRGGDMEIVGLQVQQGWSSETLMQLAGNFLRENGLQQAFIAHLEEVAGMESSASPEM